MAFVGHPILAEIRKGTRLRPTQTVDKSRPMIRAEGEQVPSVQPRGPPQAEPVAFSPPPPAANFAAVQRPAAQQQMMSSAPPPPPPPPGSNNSNGNRFAQQKPQQQPAAAPTGGRQDEAGHLQKLLNEIRGGVRLRHVQTVDKSGLVLSEEEQQQLLRAGTPNGSLDSQGKSPSPSMVAFSPASSSSVLSPSPPVINGWPSASSSPAQRCSPSPTGGPGQQQQQRSNQPAVRHWPEVQTEAERQAAHNRQHSDYQFDEQKQIEERQKEVAALTGVGSASSKIAAFRQLLQQPTASTLPAHCTLPRAPKTTATWKNGAAATNGGGPTQQQRPPAAAKNNVNGQPPQQSQQQKRPPTQQMGNGQQQQQQQKPQQTMLNGQQQRVAVANGGGQPQQNGLNRCNSHGQAQQPTPMASTPTSFHQQHQNQQQQQQQPHYHQQMPSPAAAAPKWQQPQPQAMIPVCPPPPRPAFQQQKNGFVSSTPTAPAAARSPQAAPFFRSYTPRATGGAHRQNFDRIRGQFKGAAGGPAEEPPQERGAEAVWKNAARQRKEQQQLPPPLPSCPPPPLDGSQPPEWETLREQFKFAVDLDSGPEGKALIRIVRR